MWNLELTGLYTRKFKKFHKKHSREAIAVLNNLDTYHKTLNRGINPLQIKAGWIHPETQGAVAIDQKGGGKDLLQTRLYIYPDVESGTVYLITIGDKNSQKADIADCRKFINQLRKE